MQTTTPLVLLLVLGAGTSADASVPESPAPPATLDLTGTPPEPPAESELPPSSVAPGTPRPVPDYDSRPPPQSRLGQKLLWVPRAALYPLHAVSEYALRRPIVGAVTWSEEHYVIQRVHRLLTSDDGKTGVYPYFVVDTGMRPRVGVVGFSDSLGHPDNDFRISGSFARSDAFSVTAQDVIHLRRGQQARLIVRVTYAEADDNRFFGFGPTTDNDGAALFAMRRADGSARFEHGLGGLNRATVFVRVRDASFGASRFDGTSADLLSTYGGPGQPPLPPGWEGYQLFGGGGKLTLDSRDPSLDHPGGATGVRLELDGALSAGATDPSDLLFCDWGAELAGFVDVSGHENVFGARVATRFQEHLGHAPVPFTERLSLGGAENMRAFLFGRFRGDSTFVAELQYRYTIAAFVDAELFSGVGNAFDGHLQGLRPAALFWSNGLSLRTTFSRDSSWAVGIAVGSNRFDSPGFAFADNVRLFAGLNQGF